MTSALERIQHEAENLNKMIGQLLTLTRMETGAQEIIKTEPDLGLWYVRSRTMPTSKRVAAIDR